MRLEVFLIVFLDGHPEKESYAKSMGGGRLVKTFIWHLFA
jgi:hypothetical protein